MLRDEAFEFGNELAREPAGEVGVDAILDRGQPELLEAAELGERERLVPELRQRRTAPQRERLAERRRGIVRVPLGELAPSLGRAALEHEQVELVRGDVQLVRPRPGLERLAEGLSELGDVRLEYLRHGLGRALAPEGVDQLAGRNCLTRVQEQHSEERPRLPSLERDRPPVLGDLERPEDPEVHAAERTTVFTDPLPPFDQVWSGGRHSAGIPEQKRRHE